MPVAPLISTYAPHGTEAALMKWPMLFWNAAANNLASLMTGNISLRTVPTAVVWQPVEGGDEADATRKPRELRADAHGIV